MPQVQIPAAIIYAFKEPRKLDGPVPLFSRVGVPKSTYPPSLRATLEASKAAKNFADDWVIVSIKVNQTRFWACSSAVITLARPMLDPDEVTRPAPVHPEMLLAIDLGYDSRLYGLPEARRLRRVLTGYVDTISYKGTAKRMVCQIMLRDRVRFLIDNKLFKVYTVDATGDGSQTFDVTGQNRTDLIKSLISDGAGNWEDDTPVIPRDDRNINAEPSERLPLPIITDPDTSVGQLYNVMNRFPIDIVKHLSSLEGSPREFFADPYGRLHWVKRRTANLDKPKDYWFRNKVVINGPTGGIYPVISLTTDWSTQGMANEFILVNANTSSTGPTGGALSLRARLKTLETLGFDMAQRTRFIFDDTLRDEEALESALFLDAMLMLFGKDVRSGTVEVPGDPEMQPGEAVRVWGVGLFPAPDNLFRSEAVIHSYMASGPKKGYRTHVVYAAPETVLTDHYSLEKLQHNQDFVVAGGE